MRKIRYEVLGSPRRPSPRMSSEEGEAGRSAEDEDHEAGREEGGE